MTTKQLTLLDPLRPGSTRAARKLDPRAPPARDVQHRAARQRPASDGLVRRRRRGQRRLRDRRRGLGPAARTARRPLRSDDGARRRRHRDGRSMLVATGLAPSSTPPAVLVALAAARRDRRLRRSSACVRTLLPGDGHRPEPAAGAVRVRVDGARGHVRPRSAARARRRRDLVDRRGARRPPAS